MSAKPSEPPVPPQLLALLVCPADKGELRVDGQHLRCTVCGRLYPVEDGIPNMLAGESE